MAAPNRVDATAEKDYTKWAAMEAVVGTEKRLGTVAKDLVKHFEERLEAMDGKAMIVCMSRRICVDLYNEIVRLRPSWHGENDDAGVIKIVMTGSATDGPDWQGHIRDKRRREALGKRFKNAKDPFKVVIVRDMWLTGFDVPSLHTMYVDKPMRGHGLMQAIARVNRVFKDKPGGLVVDYLGIAHELKLAAYDDLPDDVKQRLKRATALHDFNKFWEMMCREKGSTRPALTEDQRQQRPAVSHPVFLKHPITDPRR